MNLEELFRTENSIRHKFLSRLFGLFSENLVRIWCRTAHSPYEDLRRPVLTRVGTDKGYALDFTLRSKQTSKTYIAEPKSWMEYENYRYLTLFSSTQLYSMGNTAFEVFLEMARQPSLYPVRVNGNPVSLSGSILIWGRVHRDSIEQIKADTGIADLISQENTIGQLVQSGNEEFTSFIQERARWSSELFQSLTDDDA
jgi:hypothetical protein